MLTATGEASDVREQHTDLGTRHLVVLNDVSRTILLDLDGDAVTTTDVDAFDAELVLQQLDDRNCAFYDVDGKVNAPDDRYELILVDFDRDGVADVAHVLSDGEWSVIDDPRVPLVQVDRFVRDMSGTVSSDWRNKALDTLRAFYLAEQ